MRVDRIISLIHPCCYEPIDPEQIRRDNLQLYLDREVAVKTRWLAEIARRGEGTLFVQLGGPGCLGEAAAAALGEGECRSAVRRELVEGDWQLWSVFAVDVLHHGGRGFPIAGVVCDRAC